jgi:hypothetical protein
MTTASLPRPVALPNDLALHFEAGRTYSLDELPERSIALDGAVRGPAIDSARQRYSFDHHEGVIRHVTLATCEQVFAALRVGLDPRGFSVFVNDLDGDTMLSVWMLAHPDRALGPSAARVEALVAHFGRVDALGPGWGEPHPLHVALTPPRGEVQKEPLLHGFLKILDRWWDEGIEPSPPRRDPSLAFWLARDGNVEHGEVDQMQGLYARASVGVLHGDAPNGTRAYTIGKSSEFVDYDVRGFLDAMNAAEPGWGGGSTIGGAPRGVDGSRSTLPLERVVEVFAAIARRSR